MPSLTACCPRSCSENVPSAAAFLGRLLVAALVLAGASHPGTVAAQQIALALDASKTGAKIDRNIFGQFAEHLGHGRIRGRLGRPRLPHPQYARHPQRRRRARSRHSRCPTCAGPAAVSPTSTTGARASAARPAPVTLNPNWGGVIEPNTFGTHEFMDFVGQIGAEAYVSVNVGSGTPQEAAEWLEYLTTAQPTALAKERAANGHPAPYKVAYLGHRQRELGLRRQHVAGVLPEPAEDLQPLRPQLQPGAAAGRAADAEDRRGARRRRAALDRVDRHDHEGLAGPHVELGHRRPVAALLHRAEVAALLQVRRASARRSTRRSSRPRSRWTASSPPTRRSWTSTIPQKKIALVVDEWGAWYAPLPGSNPGFLAQQNSLRDAVLAALNLNIFARHADRVRMANIAQMVNVLQAMILTDKEKMVLTPTYHVFRMYVPVPGRDVRAGHLRRRHLHARRHHAAARRRHRGQGRRRHAVAGPHQPRSQPARRHRGEAWPASRPARHPARP